MNQKYLKFYKIGLLVSNRITIYLYRTKLNKTLFLILMALFVLTGCDRAPGIAYDAFRQSCQNAPIIKYAITRQEKTITYTASCDEKIP